MFKSYTQIPFVDEKAKVNASYYVTQAAAKSNQRDFFSLCAGDVILRNCDIYVSRLDCHQLQWFYQIVGGLNVYSYRVRYSQRCK